MAKNKAYTANRGILERKRGVEQAFGKPELQEKENIKSNAKESNEAFRKINYYKTKRQPFYFD